MAKNQPSTSVEPHGTMKKLSPIPKGAKVQKRTLLRSQLPASSKSPIIYMSSHTPLISAVKRVRKLLDKSLRSTAAAPKNASLHTRVEALQRTSAGEASGTTPMIVTVLGTGKAVEKTLSLASWFEQEKDCDVKMRTKTVGTVDDIIVEGGDESRVRKVSCLEVTITLK